MVIPPLPTIERSDIPPAATSLDPTSKMLSTVAGTPAAQVSSDAMRGTNTPAASLSITAAAAAAAAATTTTSPKTSDPVQTTSVTAPPTTRIFSSDIELTNFATIAHSRITKIIAHLDPPQSDLEKMMPGSRQSYGDFAKSMLIELESRGITREALCLASQRAGLDGIAPTDANATRLQLHAPIPAPGWDSVPSSEQWDIATFCTYAGLEVDMLVSKLPLTELQKATLEAALSPGDLTRFDRSKKKLECIQEFGITKTQMKDALTKAQKLNSIQYLNFPQTTPVSPTAKPLTFNDTERKNFALLVGVRINKAAGFLQPPQRDLFLRNPKPGQNYGDFAESILKELEKRGITEEEFSTALITEGLVRIARTYLTDKRLLNQPLPMNGWSDKTPDADKWCTDDKQLRNLSYLIGPHLEVFSRLNLPDLERAKLEAVCSSDDESPGEQAYKRLKILQEFGVTKGQILNALSLAGLPEIYKYLINEEMLNEALESKWDSVSEGQKWCTTMKALIDLSEKIQNADRVFIYLKPPRTELQQMKISASSHHSESPAKRAMKALQLLQEFGYTLNQLAAAMEEMGKGTTNPLSQFIREKFNCTPDELRVAREAGKIDKELAADLEWVDQLEDRIKAEKINTDLANQLRRQKFP